MTSFGKKDNAVFGYEEYGNLHKPYHEIGWWPKTVSTQDRESLAGSKALVLTRWLSNDEDWDEVASEMKHRVWSQIQKARCAAHLFLVSYFIETKGRVRSYKGLFPYRGRIKEGRFAELEVDVSPRASYFLGLAELAKPNVEECMRLAFYEGSSALILSPSASPLVLEAEVLEEWAKALDVGTSSVQINHKEFLKRILSRGWAFATFPFSPNGESISFVVFTSSSSNWFSIAVSRNI